MIGYMAYVPFPNHRSNDWWNAHLERKILAGLDGAGHSPRNLRRKECLLANQR